LLDTLHTAYQGAEIGQVFKGNRIIDLTVILDAKARIHAETVADLRLKTPNGKQIRLRDVADVFLSDGRFLIRHDGVTRQQLVRRNVGPGMGVPSFVAEAERRLKDVKLPGGTYFAITGEHEARQTAQHELVGLGSACLVGILLLLWTVFRSLRLLL